MAELSGLRDGLIQVLGMIAAEIGSRPPGVGMGPGSAAGMAVGGAEQGAPNLPGQKVLERATERIASLTTGKGEASVEREAKLALGLLLKHRGGPGFGHGRLDGAFAVGLGLWLLFFSFLLSFFSSCLIVVSSFPLYSLTPFLSPTHRRPPLTPLTTPHPPSSYPHATFPMLPPCFPHATHPQARSWQ